MLQCQKFTLKIHFFTKLTFFVQFGNLKTKYSYNCLKKKFLQLIIKKKIESKWFECLTMGMEKPDKPTKKTIYL